ncbi:MAG: 4a-hydroxytetrahydrobiopterin dehydratase [Planctomycetota bacterium]
MPEALSSQAIDAALADLPGWSYADDKLAKRFTFNDFVEALAFINRVGEQAEALGHHPELFNVYNTVEIKLNTHDADGRVTQKDIDLAGKIEAVQ